MDASATACDYQLNAQAAQSLRNRNANASLTTGSADKRYLTSPVRNHRACSYRPGLAPESMETEGKETLNIQLTPGTAVGYLGIQARILLVSTASS
jgi:hypothetical protein